MDRPHRAARIEDALNRRVATALWARGWRVRIEPFTGYGAPGWVRILARTVLAPPPRHPTEPAALVPLDQPHSPVRGWRSLATAQVAGAHVRVTAGSKVHRVRSDRDGYVDVVVAADLAPGWHDVELAVLTGTVTARVVVVDPGARTGVVSDIDDTVMVTWAPRPLLAIWNTFVLDENARRPVAGMADLYARLLDTDPRAPIVYLSTGAWNAAPALRRFLHRNGYPAGPLLLTDWGPTSTGWFRRGAQHKRDTLRRLTDEFPLIRWILVGDDGQRDPEVYTEIAAERPERVEAVAIRQLTGAEQTLAHGAPAPLPDAREALDNASSPRRSGVPMVTGDDGAALARALHDAGIDLAAPTRTAPPSAVPDGLAGQP